ncbi:MAG: hypothetical protein ABIY90_10485 [Puia sp.]
MTKRVHSLRKLLTGFIIAAFNDWQLTVIKVINKRPAPEAAKIHQGMPVYARGIEIIMETKTPGYNFQVRIPDCNKQGN